MQCSTLSLAGLEMIFTAIKKATSGIWNRFWLSDKLAYAKASILNTTLGITVMYALYAASQSKQLAVFSANFIGYFISILNYNNIGFGRKTRPPYLNYGIVYLSTFILNLCLVSILMGLHANFYLAQIFVVPVVAIFQWIALNFWIFK